MKKKRQTFSEQIRRLIEMSGQTAYRISKETGVEAASLSRFLSGERGLTTSNLDALAAYLGWTVSADKPANKPTKKKGT